MPALFCLAVQSALTAAQGELREGEAVFAYLDDVYLLTTPDRCAEVLLIISRHLQEKCGISVNQGKLQSWCPRGGPSPAGLLPFSTPEHTVWRSDLPAEDNGVVVVGTPIGRDSFVSKVAEEKGCEQDSFLEQIGTLPSSQAAWLLLLFCAVPGLTICCAPSRQARLSPSRAGTTNVCCKPSAGCWVLVLTPTRRRGTGSPGPFGRDRPSFLKILADVVCEAQLAPARQLFGLALRTASRSWPNGSLLSLADLLLPCRVTAPTFLTLAPPSEEPRFLPISSTSTASRTGHSGRLFWLAANLCPPASAFPTKTATAGNDTRAELSRSASMPGFSGTSLAPRQLALSLAALACAHALALMRPLGSSPSPPLPRCTSPTRNLCVPCGEDWALRSALTARLARAAGATWMRTVTTERLAPAQAASTLAIVLWFARGGRSSRRLAASSPSGMLRDFCETLIFLLTRRTAAASTCLSRVSRLLGDYLCLLMLHWSRR